jgi:hypothetical protein
VWLLLLIEFVLGTIHLGFAEAVICCQASCAPPTPILNSNSNSTSNNLPKQQPL